MKITALILSLSVLAAVPVKVPGFYVLCYHGLNSSNNKFSFLRRELRQQLEYLKANGFRFVTFSDIDNGNIRGRKNILVTVDDGNRSVYDAYFSVFKPLNIKPVLAIYPGVTGRQEYALTWEQVKRLSDDGCEVASHGYFHRFLNERLFRKENAAFKREIFYSKKVLEEHLGRKVMVFIYPYGVRSPEAVKALSTAGYRYGFTIDGGGIDIPALGGGSSIYTLPRIMITRGRGEAHLRRIVSRERGEEHLGRIVFREREGGDYLQPVKSEPPVREKKKNLLPAVKSLDGVADNRKAEGTIAYTGKYRDYGNIRKIPFINLDIKEELAEPDKKVMGIIDDFTEGSKTEDYSRSQPVNISGIIDFSRYDNLYAYNTSGNGGGVSLIKKSYAGYTEFLTRLRKSYRGAALSTFGYYSLWAERIQLRIGEVKRKIEIFLNKIFT